MPLDEQTDIRISVSDLVAACREIGETRVISTGATFATLRIDAIDRGKLTRAGIAWRFDQL